jgi:hypothetical protein
MALARDISVYSNIPWHLDPLLMTAENKKMLLVYSRLGTTASSRMSTDSISLVGSLSSVGPRVGYSRLPLTTLANTVGTAYFNVGVLGVF